MYRATVSGSFRRHLSEVQAAMADLKRNRVRVLSPGGTVAIGVEEGFTFLATDPSTDVLETENSHLRAILRSDFLWVVCPDKDLGLSTAFEIGVAARQNVPIFCLHEISDDYDGLADMRKLVRVVRDVPHALELVEKERDHMRRHLTLLPGWRVP